MENGSLYYSEKQKKWVYQYTTSDGKRPTIKQRKNESVKEFKARVTDLKNKLNNGTYIQKNNDTLYDIIKRYIEQRYRDGLTQDVTYLRNCNTLKQIETTCKDFVNKPIQQVTAENIEDAKSKMNQYSQSCIDKIWMSLNKGFKIAYSRRKIQYNIMDDETLTKPISVKQTIPLEALTIEQELKLKNLLDTEYKDHPYTNIVKLQLLTGMRIGETLARAIKNYDNKKHTLLVNNTLTLDKKAKTTIGKHTKTYDKKTGIDNGKRIIPLNLLENEAERIIKEQCSQKIKNMYELMFWDYEKNTFISRQEVNSWLARINKKHNVSNKNLSTHVLRHTFITRAREKGVDMKVIQYIVGHVEGSTITNDIYTSVTDELLHNELQKLKQA